MKAMVLFSGGIDSTTCLGMAIEKYGAQNVIALSISYGQKHTKEIEASDKIVKYYNVKHIYLDLEKIFQYSDCSLLIRQNPSLNTSSGRSRSDSFPIFSPSKTAFCSFCTV